MSMLLNWAERQAGASVITEMPALCQALLQIGSVIELQDHCSLETGSPQFAQKGAVRYRSLWWSGPTDEACRSLPPPTASTQLPAAGKAQFVL
jgi:hypothetical protein